MNEGFCLVCIPFVLIACCLLETCSFLKGKRKEVELEERLGKRKLGGVEDEETVACILYKSLYSTKMNRETINLKRVL